MKKKTIILKKLNVKDIGSNYIKWLNNKKIVKYTDQLDGQHNLKSVQEYVRKINNSKNEFLYGIYKLRSARKAYKTKKFVHVGNIKLRITDFKKRVGEIGYLIGNTKDWSKGIGTIAIKKMIRISVKRYKLKKIFATTKSKNIGSIKVLKKNNFKKEKYKKFFQLKKKQQKQPIYSLNI